MTKLILKQPKIPQTNSKDIKNRPKTARISIMNHLNNLINKQVRIS